MVPVKRFGSRSRSASSIPRYDSSVSKQVASRASLRGEWASEFETTAKRSSCERRPFIGGSEDSPVSTAWMWGSRSSKHSSMLSNPELAPSTAKWGVQMWAGMNRTSGQTSRQISRRSRLSRPRIGLPSDLRLPIRPRRRLKRSAVSKSGRMTTLWTLRVRPWRL